MRIYVNVNPIAAAFSFMMTPAFFQLVVFILILNTGKEQLILIALTSVMSFYAGMGSTASTMMTGKDFFRRDDDDMNDVTPPSKVTRESKTTVEPLVGTPESAEAQ